MNDAPPASLWRAAPALLALALAMATGFTMMGAFGTVQEGAKAELALSDYTLSIIQGVGAAVPLVLFSIPIGLLVDRVHRVRLLLALALLWTLGTVLTAAAGGAAMLFVARMLTGIGTTGALTAALSLAADVCAPAQRGRAMLIVTIGKSAGIAGGFAITGALFGLIGHGAIRWFGALAPWRGTQWLLAILAAALLLPLLLLREPPRQERGTTSDARFRIVAGDVWARRRFLLPLFVGQVTVVMADNAAIVWAAPVLRRNYGLAPDQFAGWMGALLLGTGIVGALLGGVVADVGSKSGRRGGVLIGAMVAAAIGTPAALFSIAPDVTWFAILFGLLVLAGTVTGLVTSVALTVLLPNEIRGLSIGAFIAFAGLIGYGIAPTLVVAVSGLLGGEAHLGAALAATGLLVGIVSVIAFWLAIRHAPAGATAEPV